MGYLDNEYATWLAAPSVFRDAAEQKLADFASALNVASADRDAAKQQVVTLTAQLAQLQVKEAADQVTIADLQTQETANEAKIAALQAKGIADQATIADLQTQMAALQTKLTAAQANVTSLTATVAALNATIASLNAQLAASSAPNVFSNLQKRQDWSAPATGPLIGGNVPAAMSRSWDTNGNLVLQTTGNKGEYDDWITAIHLNVLTSSTSYCRMDFGILLDDKQSFVQCHEFDTEFVIGGMKYNGSAQIDYSKGGMLNIANGIGGGWLDTGILVGRLPAGHHTMRWEYGIDQAAKNFVYYAFTLDGKRYPVYKMTTATEPAATTNWRDGFLTIQLQEDTNSQGGSFQTVYDNIQATIL